jgi:hypothetical protein
VVYKRRGGGGEIRGTQDGIRRKGPGKAVCVKEEKRIGISIPLLTYCYSYSYKPPTPNGGSNLPFSCLGTCEFGWQKAFPISFFLVLSFFPLCSWVKHTDYPARESTRLLSVGPTMIMSSGEGPSRRGSTGGKALKGPPARTWAWSGTR